MLLKVLLKEKTLQGHRFWKIVRHIIGSMYENIFTLFITGMVFTIKQEVDTDMFESLSSTGGTRPIDWTRYGIIKLWREFYCTMALRVVNKKQKIKQNVKFGTWNECVLIHALHEIQCRWALGLIDALWCNVILIWSISNKFYTSYYWMIFRLEWTLICFWIC